MSRYLLDTHTAMWFFDDNAALSSTADRIICNGSNRIYMSIISAWELTIKISLGKLRFPGDVDGFIKTAQSNEITIIPIETTHLSTLKNLPHIHRDPFDRLLIATAISEDMKIITVDDNIMRYDVPIIW